MIYIYIAVILASFASGWQVHSWKNDSENAAAIEAVQKTEKAVSATLEEKLATLRANERIIEREKIKIINRDVYHNVCLDADGLSIINASKRRAAKPTDAVR